MTIMPPPQYDHPPSIPVIEHVMEFHDVQVICLAEAEKGSNAFLIPVFKKNGVEGCASIYGNKCFIYRIDKDDVARHERAHCNGWPADHPVTAAPLPEPPVTPRVRTIKVVPAPESLVPLPSGGGVK